MLWPTTARARFRAKHQQTYFDSGRRFEHWAFNLVPIASGWRALDAGCGWGRFTWSLIDEYGVSPEQIVCCDLSGGSFPPRCHGALISRGAR